MPKIMLVEDDNNLREIYGERLLAEGYEIVSASNGEEALALAVKELPDLIISDVMMPKISGFDMLDILRQTPETKNTKIIMMTALSQLDDKNRADRLGADKYLVKSQVTLEDVARVVHDMLYGPSSAETTPVAATATPEPVAVPPTAPAVPAAPSALPTPEPATPTQAIPAPAEPIVVQATALATPPAPEPVAAPVTPVASAPTPEPTVTPISVATPPADPLATGTSPQSAGAGTPEPVIPQEAGTSVAVPAAEPAQAGIMPQPFVTLPEPSAPVESVPTEPAPVATPAAPSEPTPEPVAAPAPAPEPVQNPLVVDTPASAPTVAPSPVTTEPVSPTAAPQSVEQEVSAVAEQIESFLHSEQPAAPHQEPVVEPSAPVESVPTEPAPVATPAAPSEPTPEPVAAPVTPVASAPTTEPVEPDTVAVENDPSIPTPQDPGTEDVAGMASQRKRVISPIHDPSDKPNIYQLYEKEMAQEAASTPAYGQVVSQNTNPLVATSEPATPPPLETLDPAQLAAMQPSQESTPVAPTPVAPPQPEPTSPSPAPATPPPANSPDNIAL